MVSQTRRELDDLAKMGQEPFLLGKLGMDDLDDRLSPPWILGMRAIYFGNTTAVHLFSKLIAAKDLPLQPSHSTSSPRTPPSVHLTTPTSASIPCLPKVPAPMS